MRSFNTSNAGTGTPIFIDEPMMMGSMGETDDFRAFAWTLTVVTGRPVKIGPAPANPNGDWTDDTDVSEDERKSRP